MVGEKDSDSSSESELGAIAEEAEGIREAPPSVTDQQATKKKKKKRKFFRLPFKRKKQKVIDGDGPTEEAESRVKTKSSRCNSGSYSCFRLRLSCCDWQYQSPKFRSHGQNFLVQLPVP